MPSYLSAYQSSASDRSRKFVRAVESFLKQSYSDSELIIVSDGCEITNNIVINNFNFERVKLISIDKQPLFSGNVRQKGIEHATGDIITYLDSDDFYKNDNHLSVIVDGFKNNHDWIYFNDFIKYFVPEHLPLAERDAKIGTGTIGTSNIAHKNHKDISWIGCDGYNHDFTFILKMNRLYSNHCKISGCSYIVCHIPNSVDV